MAFVFFAAELYATAVLVYVRAPPAAPTIGLFTAFLTIISVRPVYAPAPPTTSHPHLTTDPTDSPPPQIVVLPRCLPQDRPLPERLAP